MMGSNDFRYNIPGMKMNLMQLRNNINANKRFWKHILSTNCYAFALGLDVKQEDINDFAYNPGVISDSYNYLTFDEYTYFDLINQLYDDLNFLGIDYRIVDPKEEIGQDEWKIAIFISILNNGFNEECLEDFHFLRQNNNGIWYHKRGFKGFPSKRDDNLKIITDPRDCYIKNYDYKDCYCLKLKK